MTFKQYFLNEIALNMLTPEEDQFAMVYARMVYEILQLKKEYEKSKDESYKRMIEDKNHKVMELYQYVLSTGTDKKLFFNTCNRYLEQLKKH